MKQSIFAVGNEPYLLWEEDVLKRTKSFLEGLDPDFFSYLLHMHIEADDEDRASVAIRLTLHHATETMFSLIGAFIQAPDCPYAWLARCSNQELREIVKRINEKDRTLLVKFKLQRMDWESIAATVFSRCDSNLTGQQKAVEGFPKIWKGLAEDFLDETFIEEYNAIKHGFRAKSGGFSLAIGPSVSGNSIPPDSEMTPLGSSKYGAHFYKIEKAKGGENRNIYSKSIHTNWTIERDILLLQLTQLSIKNIISAMKIANGFPPSTCLFLWPESEEDYSKPWRHSAGINNMIFSSLKPAATINFSKAELLQKLRDALGENILS